LVLASAGADARERDRTLKLYFTHTGERGEFTYKRNGKFDPAALKKINHFLRDWRRNEPTKMDPRLFDIIWEVYREVGGRDYIHVVSGYRSMKTNDMLRRRGRGAAKRSLHTRGQAMDFFIPGVPVSKIRKAGLRLQRGGVGYYPKSGSPFVHLDTGSVRHWPRMTRQQLAAVFPKGGTLHVPSDGKPLPGYELAKARLKKNSTAVAYLDPTSRSIRTASQGPGDEKRATVGKWLKRAFAGGADEEEDNNLGRQSPVAAPTIVAEAEGPAPLPRELSEPARRIALASLVPAENAAELAPGTANEALVAMAEAAPTTLDERLAPAVPASQTQDQIRLARLMAQAALRAEEATPAPEVQTAEAAITAPRTSEHNVESETETASFTVASGPAPTPVRRPEPLVAASAPKASSQSAGSAIDVAISATPAPAGKKTITVTTENTLALAYAGLGTGNGFSPAQNPDVDAGLSVRPAKMTPMAPQLADPLPTADQSDDIIDRELPVRPVAVAETTAKPSENEPVVDFARFLGGETTRTSVFAALEMPHPFAVPGFFNAPQSIVAASSYQSGRRLRFDRFASAETERDNPESDIVSVAASRHTFGKLY
jgi:uncharacterized protein YcbK (DUF882 family)